MKKLKRREDVLNVGVGGSLGHKLSESNKIFFGCWGYRETEVNAETNPLTDVTLHVFFRTFSELERERVED